MRKLLFIATLLCGMLAITACGNDSKDEPKPTSANKAEVIYNISFSDVSKYATVIVYYVGDNGAKRFDALEKGATSWSRKVTFNSLPTDAGVQLAISPFQEAEFDKDTYDFSIKATMAIQLYNGSEKFGSANNYQKELSTQSNIAKKKAVLTLANIDGRNWGLNIKKDGTVSAIDMELK